MKFVQYSNVSSTNLQRLEVLQDPARVLPGLRGSPPTRDPAGVRLPQERGPRRAQGAPRAQGTNCIKIGLPGKLVLSKRKGLQEVLFS